MRWQPNHKTLYLWRRIPAVGLGDFTGGFCRSAPGKSTQIRGNRSPMSPLTVRNAHVPAMPSHSAPHRQPAKKMRSQWREGQRAWQGGGRGGQDRVPNTDDRLPANPVPGLLRLHLSRAACFSANEGSSRLFKSARHPRKELKLTVALCTEDYSLQF